MCFFIDIVIIESFSTLLFGRASRLLMSKSAIFISPDGHQRCSINPNGFQWFDLSKDDPKYILEESIKAINTKLDEED